MEEKNFTLTKMDKQELQQASGGVIHDCEKAPKVFCPECSCVPKVVWMKCDGWYYGYGTDDSGYTYVCPKCGHTLQRPDKEGE